MLVLRTTCSLWIAQEEEKAARRRLEVQVSQIWLGWLFRVFPFRVLLVVVV